MWKVSINYFSVGNVFLGFFYNVVPTLVFISDTFRMLSDLFSNALEVENYILHLERKVESSEGVEECKTRTDQFLRKDNSVPGILIMHQTR